MRLTARRLAILASAAQSDTNVNRLGSARAHTGSRHTAVGVTGDCTPQVEFLLTHKLLTVGQRQGSLWAPTPYVITALGREVLAANTAAPAPTGRAQLVAAVRAHAAENYDKGGWDVIVECWDDEQIAERIGRARTLKGALAKFAPLIDVWADRQAAHDAEIIAAVGKPEPVVEHVLWYAIDGGHEFYATCRCGEQRTAATRREVDYMIKVHGQEALATSAVQCRYYPDGELSSATRTWTGKVGRAVIDVDGYETREAYAPGWSGVTVLSEGYCDHDNVIAGATGTCSICIPF